MSVHLLDPFLPWKTFPAGFLLQKEQILPRRTFRHSNCFIDPSKESSKFEVIAMRLRLYRYGTKARISEFRFDRFPAQLSVEATGGVQPTGPKQDVTCVLFDIGGQIEIHAADMQQLVEVNDAPIEAAPLMPGDCLRIGNQKYLVSYERTANEPPPTLRCRISAE